MPFDINDPSQLAALGNRDYLSQMGGGSGWEAIKGPAPQGYHYNANGDLQKDSFLDSLDQTVMSPGGFAAGIGGMAVLPALLGGGGAAAGGSAFGSNATGAAIASDPALAGLATGGSHLGVGSILGALGDIGQIAGKAGAASAAGRQQEALLGLNRDRAAADLYNTESNNALNASKMGLAAPNARMKQVLLGELLANSHGSPQAVGSGRQHIVQYQTGLDALGAGGHAGGADLARQALQALLTKSDVPNYPTPPPITPIPKASAGENIGAGLGIGGSILGALKGLF